MIKSEHVGGGALGSVAVVLIGSYAGCVGHGMSNVALLINALEQMSHGASSQHGHVLAAVSLRVQRNRCLLHVVLTL